MSRDEVEKLVADGTVRRVARDVEAAERELATARQHIASSLLVRESDPAGALALAYDAARKAIEHGMKKVDVFVKGPGSGRETAIRSLQAGGLEVGAISDVSPQPHNGCRPPKRRRV